MVDLVWTHGAELDLLELHRRVFEASDGDTHVIHKVLEQPLDESLDLLRKHPEIAPRVRGSKRIRRRTLGPGQRYGLFYSVENRGIIVHALLDLRSDPALIWRRISGI